MTVCLHSLLCGQPFIRDNNFFFQIKSILRNENTITAYPWCDGHSTSISACEVWGVRDGIQIFRRELYTHIHDETRVKFLSFIKKKEKKRKENTYHLFDSNGKLNKDGSYILLWVEFLIFSSKIFMPICHNKRPV